MANRDNTLQIMTKAAAADLSANQYQIVQDQGDGTVNVATDDTDPGIVGILQNKPAAVGRHASVGYRGPSKVMAGAAINTVNALVTTNGSGRAVVAGSGDMIIGNIMETAAADGDIVSVNLGTIYRLSGSAV